MVQSEFVELNTICVHLHKNDLQIHSESCWHLIWILASVSFFSVCPQPSLPTIIYWLCRSKDYNYDYTGPRTTMKISNSNFILLYVYILISLSFIFKSYSNSSDMHSYDANPEENTYKSNIILLTLFWNYRVISNFNFWYCRKETCKCYFCGKKKNKNYVSSFKSKILQMWALG